MGGPLGHHFSALAAAVLLELAARRPAAREATGLLQQMVAERASAAGQPPLPWDGAIRARVAEGLGKAATDGSAADQQATPAGSLRHLADLAAEADGKTSKWTELGFDPTTILTKGYLSRFT